MTDDQAPDGSPGVLSALLNPLRLPNRVLAEIEAIAAALGSLSSTAEQRLESIDERAGALVKGLNGMRTSLTAMRGSLTGLEGNVKALMGLEATIEQRMEAVREDLNTRMLAVEHEVRAIQLPINEMARDVAKVEQLLPEPTDGPLTRLKDTLTSS